MEVQLVGYGGKLNNHRCVSIIQKLSYFIKQQMWHTINCATASPIKAHSQIPSSWSHECLARNYNYQTPLLLPVTN